MRRVLLVGGLTLVLAAGGFVLALSRDAARYGGRIYPGVSISGIAVGALTPEEARRRVEPVIAERLRRTIGIEAGGLLLRPTLADLGVRAEDDTVATAVYALGREPSLLTRLGTRWRLRRGIDIPLTFRQEEGAVRRVITDLAQTVNREPRDARVTVVDDLVVLTDASASGRRLNVEQTTARVHTALARGEEKVEAVVLVTRPRFTTEDALSLTTPIARYSTRFVNIPNRNHNIGLAAGKLRGALLLPGDVFSFNQTVGPRTPDLGYRPAPVLLNNILVPGDGGGVCQVSSTLFNTALLADLTILERHNHTRPVAYLPIGRDATVVYGGQDLRFQNTTGYPLLLWSTVQGRRLTITLYGPGEAAREVTILVSDRVEIPPPTHTLTRSDPELPEGQTVIDEPKPGYRTRTYRIVTRGGVEVKRELIARSVYTPLPRTIRLGGQKPTASPHNLLDAAGERSYTLHSVTRVTRP